MSKFGQDIKKWAEKVKAGEDQVIRSALFQVSGEIIKRTPVGNPALWQSKPPKGYVGGTARGNWLYSINKINPTHSKKLKDKSGTATLNKLAEGIANATGNVFYLTNSVPYIMRLEYQGWSTQAPAGMVRVSVLEFNEALRKSIAAL